MSALEVEVRPPWPYRLPQRGMDGVMRGGRGACTRLLQVDGEALVVTASPQSDGAVAFRAAAALSGEAPSRAALERGIERMRFALSVDEDYTDFYAQFKRDPLLGPAIRRRPWFRPRRRPWPWEALIWGVTEQLIEAERAGAIQRRIVHRWGRAVQRVDGPAQRRRTGRRGPTTAELRDVPVPDAIAALSPAQLAACDLAPKRALALIKVAREVASGRVEPADPSGDRRLRAISEIGPWTIQCLGLRGRGEPDSLPAGDLAYIKLVGVLAGLGRRATVAEVEEWFEPYAPYRGLAGAFLLADRHRAVAGVPRLSLAA